MTKNKNGRKRPIFSTFLALTAVIAVLASGASAQSIRLTPEQQQLLNQLPPAQRDAALRQIQQLAPQASTTTAADRNDDVRQTPVEDSPRPAADDTPRLAPGDTLILSGLRAEDDFAAQLLGRLLSSNPYVLDDLGRIELPGVGTYGLAGLTEAEAVIRLQSEPALAGIAIGVDRLPLSKVGVDALQPFGYAIFAGDDALRSGDMSIPVPSDYTLGPGDSIRVQLFGNRSASYELPVERDGTIAFPELGPVAVAGMTFGQVRDLIQTRVSEQLIGTQVAVGMSDLRSIQVFVTGDVNNPGSYSVGALSTITTVLSVAGGVAENGSLRRLELKRSGRTVSVLDAYSLLLRGDTSGDARVQAGDVVFVPPVGTRVAVAGEVKRPAVYEYKGAANIADIVALAGGMTASAFGAGAKIERIVPESGMVTLDADLSSDSGRQIKILDGDTIRIPGALGRLRGSIRLEGNVERPGNVQWRPGIRLSDLIPGPDYLRPGSDLHYVLIRRQESSESPPSFLSADLQAAWSMRRSPVDLELQERDTVYVFDLEDGRSQFLAPLIGELRRSSAADQPLQAVEVGGSVNVPGQFPLEQGMRISDLIRAGGGLAQSAYVNEAELTRYDIIDGVRTASIVNIDLAAIRRGESTANHLLQPFDYLNIREMSQWSESEFIVLVGEVKFPGTYPIKRGERLSSVLDRAGGLSDLAYAEGSVFTREELQDREREQLEGLATRIQSDLASLALSDPGQSASISTGNALLTQLESIDPVGRLVIDLESVLAGDEHSDILVKDGDVLRVPQRPQSVTVIGEVQYSTSHLFDESLRRNDYIDRSGGTTAKADKRRIYVVRANGEVVVSSGSRFFARGSQVDILPGDTIVVPLDTDRVKPLALWTGITQVLYNVAIAVAAVNSF